MANVDYWKYLNSALERSLPNAAYGFGDTVYLRMRSEQVRGMITGINIWPGGFAYNVTWANGTETRHYEMELTAEFVADYTA
jgi:hypothetical protein